MTLIAISTLPDRIEFMTDTISYSYNASSLGHATKFMTFPHLDAAVLTQGAGTFGDGVKFAMICEANLAASLDDLADACPEFLPKLWEASAESYDSTVFLAGYSPRLSRFVSYAYIPEDGFKRTGLGPMFVTPSPWTTRPSGIELARTKRTGLGAPQAATWSSRPTPAQPSSEAGWRELAETVREQRALESYFRVIVAGRAHLTTIERGSISTRTIHEFNDQGDEFLQLIAWTSHPQGQVMECHCGSGKRFLDCHLAPHLDASCWCGSGQTFRACCMVQGAPVESSQC